jgi:hypothetical protein
MKNILVLALLTIGLIITIFGIVACANQNLYIIVLILFVNIIKFLKHIYLVILDMKYST